MRFLVLDTADARGSVALAGDLGVQHLEAHATNEDYSSWLLPAVHRLLAKAGVTHSQLDGYAVCAGPGSFTGLRVGLTTVKAWAEIYETPIVAASRLEAVVSEMTPGGEGVPEQFRASVIDARRDQIFAALYRQSGTELERVGDELVIASADFLTRVRRATDGQPAQWCTPDPEVLTSDPIWESLIQRGDALQVVSPPFAEPLARLALRKFHRGETHDSLSLDAEYVRRSDAEIFWKGNPSAFRP